MATSTYTFTHNAMESGIATCDTDIADENFEYLKDIQDQKQDIAPNIVLLASSGTIPLTDNTIHRISPTSAIVFSLPVVSNNSIFHQILVQLELTAVVTIDLGTTKYFSKQTPDLAQTGKFNIIYEHDGTDWVVGAIEKGSPA